MPGPTPNPVDPSRSGPPKESNDADRPSEPALGRAPPNIVVEGDEDIERQNDNARKTSERARIPSLDSLSPTASLTASLTARTVAFQPTPRSSGHSDVVEGAVMAEEASRVEPTSTNFGQPETTMVELVSTSATSSAFPESFGLAISQRGQWIAAYTSTALHILSAEYLPQVRGRFFKVRRKPIAMAISDEPQSLAILSNPHNVDVYSRSLEDGDQEDGSWRNLKQRSIIFGHEITTIALSPDSKILAAGYRGGVEIIACALDASENQRRQISCEPMAEVAFSYDGRTLLATSTTKKTRPSTIVSVGNGLDGPMTDDGLMESLPPDRAWISQLLFPERATHARQAAMLPDHDGVVAELLAFNAEEDTWGLYDVTKKQFTEKKLDVLNLAPRTHKMQFEATLPAVSTDLARVALCTKHSSRSDVLIYTVPYLWRNPSDSARSSAQSVDLAPTFSVSLHSREDASPESITALRWTSSDRNNGQPTRLIALVTSVTHPVHEDVDAVPPAASGKIVVIDTDKLSTASSTPTKVTINFDELPQEMLGDEHMDFEREVSLVRSRTQAVRRRSSAHSSGRAMSRSSTSLGHREGANGLLSPSDVSESSLTRRHSLSSITSDDTENSFGALVLPVDEPYSQQQPRSNFSLQRAATISAQSGASRRYLLALPDRPLEFRRADGSRGYFEIPHESDADNWVPPPPPYTRDPDTAHSQAAPGAARTALPAIVTAVPRVTGAQTSPLSVHSPFEQATSMPARSAPSLALQRRPVPTPSSALPSTSGTSAEQTEQSTSGGLAYRPGPAMRSASGYESINQLRDASSLVPPGPHAATPQEQTLTSPASQPQPNVQRPFTTTTAPRTAPYRTPRTPPPTEAQHFVPTPGPSPASTTFVAGRISPVETRQTFPTHNISPPSMRISQRITAQDLSRPLPPLPPGAAPRFGYPANVANNAMTVGGTEQDRLRRGRPPDAYTAESEGKRRKKGTKCLVM